MDVFITETFNACKRCLSIGKRLEFSPRHFQLIGNEFQQPSAAETETGVNETQGVGIFYSNQQFRSIYGRPWTLE